MFCTKCGKENPQTASFCVQCGCKLAACSNIESPTASQTTATRDTTPAYQKLGGGLAAIAYGRLLTAVLELIGCIAVVFIATCFEYYMDGSKVFVGFFNYTRAMHHIGISDYGILCYGSLIVTFLYAALLCCSIMMYRKIKGRKSSCIRIYSTSARAIFCVGLITFAGSYLLAKTHLAVLQHVSLEQSLLYAGAAGWLLLDTLITSLLFKGYFKNSERVKVYFETKQ